MSNESSIFKNSSREDKKLTEMYFAILMDDSHRESDKFLLQLMITKINQVERKTKRSSRIKNILRISIMVLAGASTVLLGLKLNNIKPDDLSNLVLVLTAFITFLSGLAIFWDIENYWIRTKVMLNRLKQLRYNFAFYLTDLPDPKVQKNKNKYFLEEFLEIIGDDYWERLLKVGFDSKGETTKGPESVIEGGTQ